MRVQDQKRIRANDIMTLLRQYEQEHEVVAWRRVKYAIKALQGFWVGKTTSEINISSCRQYMAFRMASNTAMSTVARELTVLRAACNHARRWERLMDVPVFEIPTDLPKREIWLFKDELKCLVREAEEPLYSFIRLAYGTGSRRRAIETLEWSQINFARRTIALAKSGEKRTCKNRPTVPMGDLDTHLREIHSHRVNQWVLGSDRDLLYDFQKLCHSVDLMVVEERDGRPAGKVTPHILRHSRATHLLEDGASIYAVAKLLGDSPTTIQKVYGHICMSSLEDELNKSKNLF